MRLVHNINNDFYKFIEWTKENQEERPIELLKEILSTHITP